MAFGVSLLRKYVLHDLCTKVFAGASINRKISQKDSYLVDILSREDQLKRATVLIVASAL